MSLSLELIALHESCVYLVLGVLYQSRSLPIYNAFLFGVKTVVLLPYYRRSYWTGEYECKYSNLCASHVVSLAVHAETINRLLYRESSM